MFWPPKPKLLDRAHVDGLAGGRRAECSRGRNPGHGLSRLIVGGSTPSRIVEQADDRLDAAGGGDQVAHHALGARDRHLVGRSPNVCLIARVSIESLTEVLVPWALM